MLKSRSARTVFGAELAAHPDYPKVSMLTVEVARGLAFSAPIRRGHGESVVLEYWCEAAGTMFGRDAPGGHHADREHDQVVVRVPQPIIPSCRAIISAASVSRRLTVNGWPRTSSARRMR